LSDPLLPKSGSPRHHCTLADARIHADGEVQPRGTEGRSPQANFYEKALFVKGAVATALWWKQLLFALRAMLLFALSGSSLGSSVHYEIRLFKLEALQSSERSSWKGRPSSLAQSPC
jgi:hypothetical protein